ncbi:MAG: glycoside hydrolase family 88 protein [Acidobacteria bacterium]|nr:glycoside hydrolase family 88 protein [Acidobacteriota bacterium]
MKLRALACCLLVASASACLAEAPRPGDPFAAADIRAVLRKTADWQLAHPRHESWGWPNAAFYAGLMAAYRATDEPRYLEAMTEVGEENLWRPGERYGHADDHAIAQTYLDLFEPGGDTRRVAPFRETVDRMMASPPLWTKKHQTIDYWWSDALFMSPPALAKLARVTGEEKYLDFMDRLWQECYELLYDEQQRLFHRDLRYRDDGKRIFWSRGNAWVLAGVARLVDELPEDRPSRGFYLRVFRALAERIASLQPEDGLWRSSLLAPPGSAPGETSGTAFFCYALAWGVNQGVLDLESFLPVIEKAWTALYRRVSEEGRLGWVQRPGVRPGRVRARDWEVYGTGAFLLAGSEVLKLRRP